MIVTFPYIGGRWDFCFCRSGQINFSSVFLVFALNKLQFFGFGVLHGLRVLSNLIFRFRFFLSAVMAVFRIFLSNAFSVFSGFQLSRKLHPAVVLKL